MILLFLVLLKLSAITLARHIPARIAQSLTTHLEPAHFLHIHSFLCDAPTFDSGQSRHDDPPHFYTWAGPPIYAKLLANASNRGASHTLSIFSFRFLTYHLLLPVHSHNENIHDLLSTITPTICSR